MANWTFDPSNYEEKQEFTIIPAGDHRVRIIDAEEKVFRSGNEGYEITMEVNGFASKLWYYLVLDKADRKKTDQRLGDFFNSFAITDYDLKHYRSWIGKVGAVRVKHEDYNGNTSAKVNYVINRKNQDKLEPWKGMGGGVAAPAPAISDSELPF